MSSKSNAYLRLSNVVKSYDGRTNAVDGISIDIERGKFVTFLGPSGSGKTTVLMMIAGFETPTAGTIQLDGRDLTRRKPYQRNIGMVFQNYALFPHMTAARNVAFPLKMRGLKPTEIRPKVDRILDLVGLKRFADKHPRELSGGQQQRVALARGLVFDPDILLLDEPLGALDKNLREQMQVEIKRIQRETGITTIYVTHDQTEAMTMSDLVAVFSNGKLEQVGPPLEIYNRPMTQFVAQFIGDSNLFDAQIDPSHPGWASVEGIGTVRLDANTPSYVAGSVCGLLVRPERICVVAAGQSDDALNSIDVQVRSIIHYGDSALVIANAPNGASVRMRIAGSLPVGLGEGKTLRVGWAPADGHLIRR